MTRTLATVALSLSLLAAAEPAFAGTRDTTTTTRTPTRDTTSSVDLKPIGMVTTDADGYLVVQPVGWIYTDSAGSVSLKPIGSSPAAPLDFDWVVEPADVSTSFAAIAESYVDLKPIGIIEDNGTGVVGLKPIGVLPSSGSVDLKPIGLDTLTADSISLKPIGLDDPTSLVGLKPIGYVATDLSGYLDLDLAGTGTVSSTGTLTLRAATSSTSGR